MTPLKIFDYYMFEYLAGTSTYTYHISALFISLRPVSLDLRIPLKCGNPTRAAVARALSLMITRCLVKCDAEFEKELG